MNGAPGEVTVRLPQSLAEHAGGQRRLTIEVGGDRTLAQVLAQVGAVAPGVGRRVQDETGAVRRYVNVYVGDVECRALDGLRTQVPPGTDVWIIPSVAGG
jgi:molybdopterin converting factor small subunit